MTTGQKTDGCIFCFGFYVFSKEGEKMGRGGTFTTSGDKGSRHLIHSWFRDLSVSGLDVKSIRWRITNHSKIFIDTWSQKSRQFTLILLDDNPILIY